MSNQRTLLRGETTVITVRFRSSIVLPSAPTWVLYDGDGHALLQGTATGGPDWSAEVTIPSTMPVEDGSADCELEFSGQDVTGRRVVLVRELTVVDAYEESRTFGLIWRRGDTSLSDTILLPREASEIKASLIQGSGDGETIASVVDSNPSPVATTSRGKLYQVEVPNLPTLETSTSGKWYPYQLVYDVAYPDGRREAESRPVYGLTPLGMSRLTSIKRYIDKGNYTDIDPNLTWSDEELLHFLVEGVQYINASPPEATYWTVDNIPSSLDSLVGMAAAWIALNARYLAETMSAFEYTSDAVNLTWDRRSGIEYKMNELKATLDNMLQPAKKAAIGVSGPGDGPRRAVGSLGLSLGPMTNFRLFGPYRRG